MYRIIRSSVFGMTTRIQGLASVNVIAHEEDPVIRLLLASPSIASPARWVLDEVSVEL